jgi:hypothetical protein
MQNLIHAESNMIKYLSFSILFFCLLVLPSCKKIYETPEHDVVINEIMPVNSITVTDEYGEYDDWIELYNLSSSTIDISGYFLTDNKKELSKWVFPQGTSISGKGYLIIWADADSTQWGLHTNFKLSSSGEEVVLSKPDAAIIDKVAFPAHTLETSYSKSPNGSGDFKWQRPTFNKSNDTP